MSDAVADTRALYWRLLNDAALSATARRWFSEADRGLGRIIVPSIALVELVYLIERRRIVSEPLDEILVRVDTPAGGFMLAPLDQDTARALRRVPSADVPDMPDRIIVATALQLGLSLIGRDEAIRRAGIVSVIW